MFLVLMAAMTKGALQLLSSSSYWGAAPVGCSGPVKPSVNAKGLVSTLMMAGLACADAMVARREAIVPPEKGAIHRSDSAFDRGDGFPGLS